MTGVYKINKFEFFIVKVKLYRHKLVKKLLQTAVFIKTCLSEKPTHCVLTQSTFG